MSDIVLEATKDNSFFRDSEITVYEKERLKNLIYGTFPESKVNLKSISFIYT